MTRVAAVDCGTNSIRLLVEDVEPGDKAGEVALTDLDRRMEVVRLGEGVDRTGRLSPGALERTFAACERYARVIDELGAERLRFVATSATRDAANRSQFTAGVRRRLGVEPEVITGDEEAALSFAGATRELDRERFPAPYLVLDIGGGSTEFVLGDDTPRAALSVDIGCVRLTERHRLSDPPTLAEVEGVRADIDTGIALAEQTVPLTEARTLVGLAGSVTTVAAMAMNLPAYDASAIHLSRLVTSNVRDVTARLVASTRAERAALAFMHPGRVDVIAAGALILAATVERAGVEEVLVSEHDILDGIALSAAGGSG